MNMKSILVYIGVMFGVLLGVGGLLWQFGQSTDKPIADIAGDSRHTLGIVCRQAAMQIRGREDGGPPHTTPARSEGRGGASPGSR